MQRAGQQRGGIVNYLERAARLIGQGCYCLAYLPVHLFHQTPRFAYVLQATPMVHFFNQVDGWLIYALPMLAFGCHQNNFA